MVQSIPSQTFPPAVKDRFLQKQWIGMGLSSNGGAHVLPTNVVSSVPQETELVDAGCVLSWRIG